jgi:hypothetical protein
VTWVTVDAGPVRVKQPRRSRNVLETFDLPEAACGIDDAAIP